MTRINKMTMQGFKSFAKHTEFLFGGDFNCVLGPNGSGKSNIIDSLCFVLGRSSSKAMRAEKSSNLIYNGGKSKKPAKEGEVAIYFDNSTKIFPVEDQEVKVSRIVRQNGQSIYKLNNKKRTRQEVLDLLSYGRIDPEGFNIILQGDIVGFTEMPSIERRQLIEDIAGIGVYEEKKQKALRELDRVEEKIKEAEIVLTERNTYLKELKNERDQALKFKDMKDKLIEFKASLCHLRIETKDKTKNNIDEKIDDLKKKFDIVNKDIEEIRREIEKKKIDIKNISSDIEEKGEKDQVDLHKQVESIKVELATNQTRVESYKRDIKKINEREEELKNDLIEQDKQIKELVEQKLKVSKEKENLQKDKNTLEGEISKFRKKNELDNAENIDKDIEGLDKDIEEKEKKINELREKQHSFLREKDRLEVQIQGMDEKINKVLEVEQENKDQIQELKRNKKLFEEQTKDLTNCLENDSSFAQQLVKLREKLVSTNDKLTALKSKQISIKEKVYSNVAMKKIVDRKNSIRGIYGAVSDLGNVSKKYSLALEIAAGNRIKSIVVENDKVGAECINYLKKNRFGVATFLPMNKMKGIDIKEDVKKLLKKPGVHGLAVDLVNYDYKFKKVFEHVFSNTIVVDDIETSRKLGIGITRMVTIDGDIVEVSGAMQGGYRERKKEGLGFQEKEITKDINEYEEVVASLQKSLSSLESKRTENERKISELRQSKANLEGDIITSEKTLHLESGDMEASKNQKAVFQETLNDINSKIDDITEKISEVNRELAGFKIKKQNLRGKISQLRSPVLIAQLNAFEQKNDELREKLNNLNSDVKNIDTQISMISPEKDKIKQIIDSSKKDIEKFNSEVNELEKHIKTNSAELKEKEVKEKEFHTKFRKLFDDREALSEEISKLDKRLESKKDVGRNFEIKMNTHSLEHSRIVAEMAGLKQEFEQYEGVKISTEKNEEQLKGSIKRGEVFVEQMGSVNMKALDIYDNVEQEYTNLMEKKDSLKVEKEDVMSMMHEIEGKKKELFMTALENVEDNFKKIFSELSTKGEASLELEEPDNPFEAGLLIKVKLSGSKFMDIRSLSGGEKTMTALAFIFAIQEHDPHSFYVLDEVDAALDKHNSEKLAKLVRKYTEKAQYVVISHNDSVISEADNLYGISMDEHGMSKVTSLKI